MSDQLASRVREALSHVHDPHSGRDLVAAKIGIELRNQYVLGYTPTNLVKDGKYRKVQVKLQQPRGLPPLKAFYRLGYYAPVQ